MIATYLAGMDSHFLEISKLMREVAATGAAALADCAATYPQAMRHGFDGTIASVPSYVVQNRRSMILVEDCHPTPLGYEIEARVVASALHALGVLPNYVPEEPTKVLDGASAVLPTLTRSAEDPRLFEITTAPKDHVILFLGSEGISRTHNAIIPLDTSVVDGLKVRYQLGDFAADADAEGESHHSSWRRRSSARSPSPFGPPSSPNGAARPREHSAIP